jgi:hypothetical protein
MVQRLEVEPTYGRVLSVLHATIRASGRTQISLDAVIGRRRGYLSHVFQRRVALKVKDLVALVRALGVDPAGFLGYLMLGESSTPATSPAAPAPARTPTAAAGPAPARGELETLIASILDRSLPEEPSSASEAAGAAAGRAKLRRREPSRRRRRSMATNAGK